MFKIRAKLFIVALIFVVSTTTATGRIIYVDDDVTGTNDGSSWKNAFTYLRDALTIAELPETEKPLEIRVAQGIYKPNQVLIPIVPDKYPLDSGPLATFSLINNVTIKGGYAGVNESDPNVRNIELYVSILSGDLDGDDIEVEDPCDILKEMRGINSINVVRSYKNDANAVLDGFTIRDGGGYVLVDPGPYGGAGMIIREGNPTIINCTFTNNAAYEYGGGIFIVNSSPTLINCTFTKNYAFSGGGICNGYMLRSGREGNPTFINCVFSNNYSTSVGAGMYVTGGDILMSNCIFTGNFCESSGGGLYTSGTVELDNCIFTNNSTMTEGGAINSYKSDSQFTDCVFENNHADIGGSCAIDSVDTSFINCAFIGNKALSEGGAISSGSQANDISNVRFANCLFAGNLSGWIGGAMNFREKINGEMLNCTISHNRALYGESLCFKPFHTPTNNFKINNSILWGGGEQIYNGNNSKITITYSNIRGGWEGEGNIDEDPLFVMPGYWSDVNNPNIVVNSDDPNAVWIEGDYHLKSQGGRLDPNSGTWVIDEVTSPCIDTGDPNSPVGDEPIPNGCRINMGAFGGSSQASLSFGDTDVIVDQACDPVPANGAVDIEADLDVVLSWASDPNALIYKVYFGTDNPPPFIRKQFEKEFYPGLLELNTNYYWRIDELDGLCNEITGVVWEFTTAPLYSRASNPNPVDNDINVELDAKLSWTPGLNAIAHDVYFGANSDNVSNATTADTLDVLVSRRQGSNSYSPGSLEYGQTYFWRIDEVDNQGMVVTGEVWSFTIISAPSGPVKGRACFTGETPVRLDGKIIPMQEVVASQIVSGIGSQNKIEKVQIHNGTFTCYDILLDSGKTITVAENHYFMTESGQWLSLHNLKAGTRLKNLKGSVGIKNITKRPEPYIGKVYNLKIEGSDRYMIGEDAIIVRDY